MTAAVVTVRGDKEVRAALERLDLKDRPRVWREILVGIGATIERIAKRENIIAGGKQAPAKDRITSRSGIGRRSIRIRTDDLPRSVSVGSDRGYMAVHEFGGAVDVPSTTVRSHRRKVVFGKRVAPFDVGPYFRMGYVANFPKRPWLEPAIVRARGASDAIMLRALRKAIG